MIYVLDTNILVYAFDNRDAAKQRVARRLFDNMITSGQSLPRQVLSELLAGAHRRKHIPLADARSLVGSLEGVISILPTLAPVTLTASLLAERYKLQYFDALICQIAIDHGASRLFSEDMHDGLSVDSMRITNPFTALNKAVVDEATA